MSDKQFRIMVLLITIALSILIAIPLVFFRPATKPINTGCDTGKVRPVSYVIPFKGGIY